MHFDYRILVVSRDRETRDSVQSYLVRVGATTVAVTELDDVPEASVGCDALLMFADDYLPLNALELLTRAPFRTCVVVTSTLTPEDVVRGVNGATSKTVVLRRPAWGWMLLDALRSALEEDGKSLV